MSDSIHEVTADATVQMIHNGKFKMFCIYLVLLQFVLLQLKICLLDIPIVLLGVLHLRMSITSC
jgi:hypothetical protein